MVLAVSVIDFGFAALRRLLAILLFSTASSLHEETWLARAFGLSQEVDAVISVIRLVALLVIALGVLGFVMGLWIRTGSPTARDPDYKPGRGLDRQTGVQHALGVVVS
jgi:hypothetical protein